MPASNVEEPREFKVETSDSVSRPRRFPLSRIIRFITVFLSVLLAANWFVFATWNHFLGITTIPAWEFIPPALTLAFVATTILGRQRSSLDCGWCIGFRPSGWGS